MKTSPLLDSSGFTLLETLIAMAIMLVAFASILMVESNSINTTIKAKQINVVTMLAKQMMVETEYLIEGKTFGEVKKEETGEFKDPYQDYQWKREVKEVKFPNINVGGTKKEGSDSDAGGGGVEMLTKLVSNFLSKALREVTVTISWKKGSGTQSYSVTTYWVDLNHEFQLSE